MTLFVSPAAATRAAAIDRMTRFVPRAAHAYASGRNHDPGPGRPTAASGLSPYLRYRLVGEQEVVSAVLRAHSFTASEKFVQEVLWRTYWKGWLELRPAVWLRFLEAHAQQRDELADPQALADAERGRTGIEGFDDWARELVETGYLHNHARMWFASIWIFTLRLPWALGADFFLRHLIDADAASNTLSWRWVAGLQTAGKTYLATTDNIARYTQGRFAPKGLAVAAEPLREPPIPGIRALPEPLAMPDPAKPALLLATPEDLAPETQFASAMPVTHALVANDPALLWGDGARQFVTAAAEDTAKRLARHFGCSSTIADRLDLATLVQAAHDAGACQIVTSHAPVGPVATALARLAPELAREGITLMPVRRAWDSRFWPHATRGFFPFKERIAAELRQLGLT